MVGQYLPRRISTFGLSLSKASAHQRDHDAEQLQEGAGKSKQSRDIDDARVSAILYP